MMSAVEIHSSTLRKLGHESSEIRLRTLEHIANKLERALALQDKVIVNSVTLCKQLIRWFGFKPITHGLRALNLLKHFLQAPEYGEEVITRLGAERLSKELKKIQILLAGKQHELRVVKEINDFLQMRENSGEQRQGDADNEDDLDDLISATQSLTLQKRSASPVEELNHEDYELPWSKPSTSDYTSMKLIADILGNTTVTHLELKNALMHSQITMKDYPAEYFLQAPHLFRQLLQVYVGEKQNIETAVDEVAATVMEFLNVLEKRLEYRKKSLYFPFSTKSREAQTSHTPSQLKVHKALSELLEASITHLEWQQERMEAPPNVWNIIFKILKIHGILKQPVDQTSIKRLSAFVMRLAKELTETEQHTRLRLYQLQFLFLLQEIVQHNVAYKCVEDTTALETLLKDYSIKCLYPKRYQQLKKVLYDHETNLNLKESYQTLDEYEQSLHLAVSVLNGCKTSPQEIIQNGQQIVNALEILQSKQLIDILYRKITEAIPLYLSHKELQTKAIDLILKMLNVSVKHLRIYAYEKFIHTFKRHLGCLMNGETYIKECSNASLLKAAIIGVPLDSNSLINIVHSSYEYTEETIQNICLKTLELLLQSTSLLEENWSTFVELYVPALPLISCCSSSKKLMELLMKLNNPDARQLPFLTVLQGNIAFLFHSQAERRSESLTRLIFTLHSLKGSEKYMPNLMHISDTLPHDICLLTAPREYQHIFSDRSEMRPESVATLSSLFNLLESPDVEPLIRKTALMQINVMCANWHITAELCYVGAYYLILQTLENALQTSNCIDYPDAAIPAVSILNKILLYDSAVRCELAETPNIYVLLLRALMMFMHDIQMRQDAAICLFQLIFANQLIATENQIEGPLILGNLNMPLKIQLKTKLPWNDLENKRREKINSLFQSLEEENQYWRFVIAEATFNGGLGLLNQKVLLQRSKFDIKEDLKLSSQDIRIVRATQPGVSLKRLIKAASNATDHKSLMQVCFMLQQQLLLVQLPKTFNVDLESSNILSGILLKYLQLQPSNKEDLKLYEHLLDLCRTCLQIPLMAIRCGLLTSLHKDHRHAFVTMITQKEEIPLIVFYKISKLLELLICTYKNDGEKATLSSSECSTLFSNLLDILMEKSLQLFEIRDLQRIRCLLSLMQALTRCNLDMPDRLLLYYCRRFLQLSLAIKSFTQTGSKWHKDCLLSILQLQRQMQDGANAFRLTPGIVKYLSGLCGHTDAEVRVLDWSILYLVSQTKAIGAIGGPTEQAITAAQCSGADMLLKELAYLPGGFMACCLSTLLDFDEIIWVRQSAGQLFANLIRKHKDIEKTQLLLDHYKFVKIAGEALNNNLYVLSNQIPENLKATIESQITTCELLSSYVQICIEMSKNSQDYLSDLCTRSFMFKLYEVFKHPVTSENLKSNSYIEMAADICLLYSKCYAKNFLFLQRTLCRDPIWLDSYCNILFSTATPPNCNETKIVAIMQLLIVLIKDDTALEHLSEKMKDYSLEIVRFFQYAFAIRHYGTSLQKCVLSVLSLLCVKAQPQEGNQISQNILKLLDNQLIPLENVINVLEDPCECIENKENQNTNKAKAKAKQKNKKESAEEEAKRTSYAISEHLCISLMSLFTHLYPMKVCKFTTAPNECHQQVVEALAILLKISPTAQETAHDLRLHEQVINIFKYFFDEFATMSCTTFVKRHGEIKKLTVVKNLQLIFKFLLSWHSAPTMAITDENLAMEYSKIIIHIWPWLAHSAELKLTVLKVCAFLCERSLIMCKRFSTVNNSSFAHSILQLTIKLTTAETMKVKLSSKDYMPVISFGLRVIMNCCSCIEGRTAMNKAHITYVFDCLYPFNPKASRLKSDILNAWLEYWEMFSRYEEGASAHNLNALCCVINRSKWETRILALRILRNMAFLNSNRTILLNSTDFLYTVNEVVSQPLTDEPPYSVEDQLTVAVALWQLVSSGIKYAAMIRGTKLSKQLRVLRDSLRYAMKERNAKVEYGLPLLQILDSIFKIFDM